MRVLPFLALLVLLNIELLGGVWRYNNILMDEKLFTTQNAVYLKYDGFALIEWEYPESCDINNKSSPNATMICTSTGFQMVKPLVSSPKQEETRHIFISPSTFTFVWYAVMSTNSSTETGYQILRLWIIDPEQADPAEINNTALKPSLQSRYTTKHFYNNGQYPVIQMLTFTQTLLGSFQNDGWYWEAEIPGDKEYVNLYIFGQPVSFQHRLVMDSQRIFYWTEPEPHIGERAVSLRLAPGCPLSLVWGTCKRHHALLLSDTGTLITKNAFLTSEELTVNPGVLPVPSEGHFTVDQAALLEDGIIFRIGGALFWRDNQDGVLTEHPELPTSGVKGLYQRTSCISDYPELDVELSSLIVWKENLLLLGPKRLKTPGRSNFLQIVPIRLPRITILTAAFGSQPSYVATLVLYGYPGVGRQQVVISYNELSRSWVSTFDLEDLPKGHFKMHFLVSAHQALLLWNKESVLYHDNYHRFQDNSINVSHVIPAAFGNKIHQVTWDRRWNMLVKMENNLLYYCKVGMHKLVLLPKWVKPDSRMVLYVNQKDQINMLTLTSDGLYVQNYPMDMEAKSAMKDTHHGCPFITFENNMNAVCYFDKGDKMVLWAKLVKQKYNDVYINFFRNRIDLLSVIEKTFEISTDVDVLKMTFIISQNVDYRDATNYKDLVKKTTGIVAMELIPSQIGNTCNMPKTWVSHISVGCPRNRHIRVARPWGIPCVMYSLNNYTIPRSALRNLQHEDLVVNYEWDTFGCLFEMHYQKPFRPDLVLYDGDNFVRDVDANFIVWERFGRKDYSFNATMRQVACLREAQTWSSMLTEGKISGQVWGPENYQSCFNLAPGKLGNLDETYEIMNRSSTNFLTFTQEENTLYVFNVKVLDPSYSFCDLHAVFAVKTYGIQIPDFEYVTKYSDVVFAFSTICILAYNFFRFVTIFRNLMANRPTF
ncbi:hypothetical protein UPYG_G00133340 [Umbra pygmaea]|uniref:Catsper channel auxiliary subunit epsilon n=1 Tax=Umbra pygmaea TaxID=75934 RepID=A0ABD0XA67_UMBPY